MLEKALLSKPAQIREKVKPTASARIPRTTCSLCAPRAMRIPISFTRRATPEATMPYTPMLASRSAITPNREVRMAKLLSAAVLDAICSFLRADVNQRQIFIDRRNCALDCLQKTFWIALGADFKGHASPRIPLLCVQCKERRRSLVAKPSLFRIRRDTDDLDRISSICHAKVSPNRVYRAELVPRQRPQPCASCWRHAR